MADVITRFRLETTQYDSKLRDAAKGLKEFTHQAQLGGKNFTDFSQKAVESARALGTVASGAMNTKEKVRDLVGAYNEAAKAYNSLSEAQQQHDFGKNLASSLETLKGRITEAKQELYGMNEAVEEVGKKSGSLFGEGGLTGMMQVFGGNLLAEGVSRLTSELVGSVQESIELGRQGEGIRMAFERLNNPGLLDELKAATHGTVSEIDLMKQAIQFSNFKLPLEDLSTYLAFAQQKAKDTGQSVDDMVNSIVTGLGRQSVQILDNLGISATEIRNRMKEGGDMTQVVADIIREEMAKAGDYVETAADRAARATADTKNKMEELGRSAMPVAEEFASAWNEIKNGAMTIVLPVLRTLADSIRDIREILGGEWDMPTLKPGVQNAAEGSNIDDNGNFIRKPSNGNWAGFNAQTGQYNNAITAIQDVVVTGRASAARTGRGIGGSRGGRGGGSRGGFDLSKIAFDPNKALLAATKVADTGPSEVWKAITQGAKESTISVKDLTKAFEELNTVQGVTAGEGVKDSSELSDKWRNAGTAISAVGSAMSQIEDPAAKVMGTIAQAIATIALTYAESLKGTFTPWDWIAGAVSGAAAMVSVISAIHSATGYAQGGIIKGNSYSGDNIGGMVDGGAGGFVGLNAGEVVLNAAQQRGVASALSEGGNRQIEVFGRLSGETIFLSADRYTRRTGRGTILTWK